MTSVGQELLAVPFPEMVLKLASAIAEGQYKMDLVSMKIAEMMADEETTPVKLPQIGDYDPGTTSMLGAGFQPTFYQFTDTIIEVKMAISMNKTTNASVSVTAKYGGKFSPYSASVTASYSSKYSYDVKGSSLLRTKITPVPPNQFLAKLLEVKAALAQQEVMKKVEETEEKMDNDTGGAAPSGGGSD